MEDSFGRAIIDKGIDKNVLIYDSYSKGDVTKRLIYYMKHNARHIDVLYFPTDVYFDFVPLNWDFRRILRAFDMTLLTDERLNTGGNWLEYYKMRGASFPCCTTNLCIGLVSNKPLFEFDDQDFILGAY